MEKAAGERTGLLTLHDRWITFRQEDLAYKKMGFLPTKFRGRAVAVSYEYSTFGWLDKLD